ncbi:MAG: hypothetical protein WBA74_27085 [Cyclobacteriaceae bacterium]
MADSDKELSLLDEKFLEVVEYVRNLTGNEKGKKVSESQISREISDDRATISKIKNGRLNLTPKHIYRLGTNFSIDYNSFFRNIPVRLWQDDSKPADSGRQNISVNNQNSDLVDSDIKVDQTINENVGTVINNLPEDLKKEHEEQFDRLKSIVNQMRNELEEKTSHIKKIQAEKKSLENSLRDQLSSTNERLQACQDKLQDCNEKYISLLEKGS